jgi:hypothetical protein
MGAVMLLILAWMPIFMAFLIATDPPDTLGRLVGVVIIALMWLVPFSLVRMYAREESAQGGQASSSRP